MSATVPPPATSSQPSSSAPVSWGRQALELFSSLKLTVVLFALSIVLVFSSTVAQKELDVWDVIHGWYRVDERQLLTSDFPWIYPSEMFVLIPLRLINIFEQTMIPDWVLPSLRPLPEFSWSIWLPRGWLIGLFMGLNLLAAHAVRFTVQARHLTWVGVGLLVVTAFMMLVTIEKAFNTIWRVRQPRRGVSSFLLYWAILSLGPLLLGAGFAVSTYITSLSLISGPDALIGAKTLLGFTPLLSSIAAFTLIYAAVPNARVPVRQIPVSRGHLAEVGAPVVGWHGQFDRGQRAVGNAPQKFVFGPKMVQHGHRVDADARTELAHGKSGLALARQHVEGGIQDHISVKPPPSARLTLRFSKRFR